MRQHHQRGTRLEPTRPEKNKGDHCTVGKEQDWENSKILGGRGIRPQKEQPKTEWATVVALCSTRNEED